MLRCMASLGTCCLVQSTDTMQRMKAKNDPLFLSIKPQYSLILIYTIKSLSRQQGSGKRRASCLVMGRRIIMSGFLNEMALRLFFERFQQRSVPLCRYSKWLNSHLFEWDSLPRSGHYLAIFNLIYINHSRRCIKC